MINPKFLKIDLLVLEGKDIPMLIRTDHIQRVYLQDDTTCITYLNTTSGEMEDMLVNQDFYQIARYL